MSFDFGNHIPYYIKHINNKSIYTIGTPKQHIIDIKDEYREMYHVFKSEIFLKNGGIYTA